MRLRQQPHPSWLCMTDGLHSQARGLWGSEIWTVRWWMQWKWRPKIWVRWNRPSSDLYTSHGLWNGKSPFPCRKWELWATARRRHRRWLLCRIVLWRVLPCTTAPAASWETGRRWNSSRILPCLWPVILLLLPWHGWIVVF